MKQLLLAAAAIIVAGPAYAQHYCGNDVEGAFNSSVVLPNGQTASHVQSIWSVGLADGSGLAGAAVQGQHRYCGEIAVYLYAGLNPSNSVEFSVKLDPSIVKPTVAQAKCTATLGRSNDVYYYGYDGDVYWPAGMGVFTDGSWTDGTYEYVNILTYGGGSLSSYGTYTVNVICPPNL